MVTSWDLEPLNLELYIVNSVLDDLHASLARVMFRPRVRVKLVRLRAIMANFYAS
jgi:hypothetical protein